MNINKDPKNPELPEGIYQIFPEDKPVIAELVEKIENLLLDFALANKGVLHNRIVTGAVQELITRSEIRTKLVAYKLAEPMRKEFQPLFEKFNTGAAKALDQAEDFVVALMKINELGLTDSVESAYNQTVQRDQQKTPVETNGDEVEEGSMPSKKIE